MFQLFRALLDKHNEPSGLLTQARDEFLEILDSAAQLLEQAKPSLLATDAPGELLERARSIDKASNRLVRSIRKLLVEHLSFAAHDAPACLILMSVAKDAERMIDECRNLVELRDRVERPVPAELVAKLRELIQEIIDLVRRTRTIFAANDERGALAVVEGEKPFIERLKQLQDPALEEDGLDAQQAVALYRAFHGIQRLQAHLANIASTVVLPVHRIDFAKRSFVEEARSELDKRSE